MPRSMELHVCIIFYLLSRYVRPEGPRQRLRRCLSNCNHFIHDHILETRTGLTNHSWVSPDKRNLACKVNRNKTKEKQRKKTHSEGGPGPSSFLSLYSPSSSSGSLRIAVLHPTLVSHRNSSTASAAFSSHRSLNEGPQVPPLAVRPYTPPHPLSLGGLPLAPGKEAVSCLPLATAAPPASVGFGLPRAIVEVGPDYCVARQ